MKVSGSATLHAPREKVWAALNDPAVLVRTIPGCQQLEQIGPDEYRMTLYAGVASVKGVYSGSVRLADHDEPASFTLRASGAGAPGTVDTQVQVSLTAQDGSSTRLDYDADAAVGGMVGGVGQRVLTGVAQRTAGQFFAAVDDVLTGRVPEATPAEPSGTEAAVPTAEQQAVGAASGGAVYRAPIRPGASGVPPDFVKGAVFGAVVVLFGVLVGAVVGRRR